MNILVLNAGSSSLKTSLYRLEDLPADPLMPIWTGQIDWNIDQTVILRAKTATGKSVRVDRSNTTRSADIQDLLTYLWQGETQVIADMRAIDIVGHRVVHGGTKYHQPILIDEQVQTEIDRLAILAPLHNPANLMGIKVMASISATLPQVAVFDTAFYGDLPETAYVYPLPYQWLEQGIRKYGFHGISHQYCANRAAQLLGQDLQELRLISCHLGNGCSLAAIKNGRCIDTTMGFTPLDGLMMGTRCGSIDPGIILHLLRQSEYTVEQLDHILNFESGLLGVSGISNDLREIDRAIIDRAISDGNTQAKLAIDLYVHILTAKIAALLPELGGVDAIVFTAGVGENHPGIRAAVAEKLAFIGVELDPDLNYLPIAPDLIRGVALSDRDISTSQSLVKLLVIHTQEEWQIARTCWQYLSSS
jgi:acetate kinase